MAWSREVSLVHAGVAVDSILANWRALRLLNLYRIIVSFVCIVVFLFVKHPSPLGDASPDLFFGAVSFYLFCSLFSLIFIYKETPQLDVQVYFQTFIDIVVIIAMMHASGGIMSGLGILLVVPVAGAGILLAGKVSVAIAAAASIALMLEQIYGDLVLNTGKAFYAQHGMLGATFFATAILANVLARRIRVSEALANQRGIDIANLAQLNEYIIQRMGSGVIVVDKTHRVRLINETAWYLLGMLPCQQKQHIEELSSELFSQFRHWSKNPNEERKMIPMPGAVDVMPRFIRLGTTVDAGALIILEDSSEMNQKAQHLKLAALGRLTASIAHEIRNPLGAISHAAQLLEESPKISSADRRLSQIISEQSVRMNRIIENVMQLSQRDNVKPQTFVLNSWISDFMDEFVDHQKIDKAHIAVDITPKETSVVFDPSHFHQVLTNLCQNAIAHGVNNRGRPWLTLRGGETRESRGPFLDVIDYGAGIDPETAQHIFEPFFTTKVKGTGLGLYIGGELCESNQAKLEYIPIPTGGSCFRITFNSPKKTKSINHE